MEVKYVAVYREGRIDPLAIAREDMAERVIQDFKIVTGKNYNIKPITLEEAKKIKEDVSRFKEPEFKNILERILENSST